MQKNTIIWIVVSVTIFVLLVAGLTTWFILRNRSPNPTPSPPPGPPPCTGCDESPPPSCCANVTPTPSPLLLMDYINTLEQGETSPPLFISIGSPSQNYLTANPNQNQVFFEVIDSTESTDTNQQFTIQMNSDSSNPIATLSWLGGIISVNDGFEGSSIIYQGMLFDSAIGNPNQINIYNSSCGLLTDNPNIQNGIMYLSFVQLINDPQLSSMGPSGGFDAMSAFFVPSDETCDNVPSIYVTPVNS